MSSPAHVPTAGADTRGADETPADDTAAARGRGRPRSAAADEAILDATRAVLAEDGWAALTVEGVAARAGVAKTTVYRRFSSRADLAVAAVAQLIASLRPVGGQSAADDIRSAIETCATVYARPAARAAFLAVIAEAGRDPVLRQAVEVQVIGPARAIVADGLDCAVQRGEITRELAEARTDLLYDVLAGALIHRLLIREREVDEDFIETLTRAVIVALGLPTG